MSGRLTIETREHRAGVVRVLVLDGSEIIAARDLITGAVWVAGEEASS